jgi:hypothetical protein
MHAVPWKFARYVFAVAGIFLALPATRLRAQAEASPLPSVPNVPQQAPMTRPATPVLVELFTSEGCSSCPPADDLLGKLNGTVAPSGQQIVVLSEHVTYWNRLGWSDPFSQPFFTDRQTNYSDKFGTDEVYTPEVVVNGARDANGSDRNAVLQAVKLEGLPLALDLHVLSLHPNNGRLTVVFTAEGKVPTAGAEVYAVLVSDSETRHVTGGENTGRTLMHVSVARSVGKSVVLRAGEQTMVSLPLPPPEKIQPESPRRLILIAQLPGQGRVIGLTSQKLDPATGKPAHQLAQASTLETR